MKLLRELLGGSVDFSSAVSDLQYLLANLSLSDSAFQIPSALKEMLERDRSMGLRLMDDRSLLGDLFDWDGRMNARAIDSLELDEGR